jgi:hypothetical protein
MITISANEGQAEKHELEISQKEMLWALLA